MQTGKRIFLWATSSSDVLSVDRIERLKRADLIKLVTEARAQPISELTRDGDQVWLNAEDLAAYAALRADLSEYFADILKHDLDLPGVIDMPSKDDLERQLTKVREEGGVFNFHSALIRAVSLSHALMASYCSSDRDGLDGIEADEEEFEQDYLL